MVQGKMYAHTMFSISYQYPSEDLQKSVLILRNSSTGYITTFQVCLLLKNKQWRQEAIVG
jgi:hypothetical protein